MNKESKGSKKSLSDSNKEYLINYRNERALAEKQADFKKMGALRQANKRIREKVLTALDDLILYAQCMPEDQLKQVFTVENLKPLFKSLTDPENAHHEIKKGCKIKNQRVFEICYLMEEIGIQNGYIQLSDEVQKMFMDGSSYKHAVVPVRSVGRWECGEIYR
jgi:hypothetical protein